MVGIRNAREAHARSSGARRGRSEAVGLSTRACYRLPSWSEGSCRDIRTQEYVGKMREFRDSRRPLAPSTLPGGGVAFTAPGPLGLGNEVARRKEVTGCSFVSTRV